MYVGFHYLISASCSVSSDCTNGYYCSSGYCKEGKLYLTINCYKIHFNWSFLITFKYKWSVSIIVIGSCPSGYVDRDGDLPGWGTDIGSQLDLSLEDCAGRCNSESTCLSFEHSPTEIKCNLNQIAEPSRGTYRDYIFCTKGKR